jgi:uncharacterized coiled-coil DUF342 family protein
MTDPNPIAFSPLTQEEIDSLCRSLEEKPPAMPRLPELANDVTALVAELRQELEQCRQERDALIEEVETLRQHGATSPTPPC